MQLYHDQNLHDSFDFCWFSFFTKEQAEAASSCCREVAQTRANGLQNRWSHRVRLPSECDPSIEVLVYLLCVWLLVTKIWISILSIPFFQIFTCQNNIAGSKKEKHLEKELACRAPDFMCPYSRLIEIKGYKKEYILRLNIVESF